MSRREKSPAGRQANTDGKTARQINTKPFLLLARALSVVGKPFYLIFSAIVIFVLFTALAVGKSVRTLASLPSLLFKKVKGVKLPKIKKPTLELPSFKVPQLPKIPTNLIRKSKEKVVYKRPEIKIPKVFVTKKHIVVSSVILVFGFFYWYAIVKDLPTPTDLVTRRQEVATRIYDRNGVLLYNIYKDHNRTIIPLENIPTHVRLATLAAEDAEFYQHFGFSIKGMARALFRNVTREELSGGSTITQQLVKNALLSSEKTVVRKVKELILALGVERTYSKDEILEMYLNEVSYGGTAYGIGAASQTYFNKDVEKLTLAEAAFLAGLPKSPTAFSPFGPTPNEGIRRQKDILRLMRINKFINMEQEEKAAQDKLSFAPNKTDIKAPHFVMYVRQYLEEKYGPELVEQGGLEVTTTLDYEIQKLAEQAVSAEVERLSRLNVGNGAAVVLDTQTGGILAMVGSKNYFDTEADGNVNVTTSLRQPGSSIKVVNYAQALSEGYTPATILNDSPSTFVVPGSEPYSPKNYDGTFRGNITLRSALAESRNVPAVKVLASYGVGKMIQLGQKMGITTWSDPSRFGLSLTLGGGEVKLIELAEVYATIANYGKRTEATSVTKITDYEGKVLKDSPCENTSEFGNIVIRLVKEISAAEAAVDPCAKEQVLNQGVAFQLIDILSDNSARTPAFGGYSLLAIPNHPEVAVKTGTSNDLRDNLAVGFNQEYLVATWVGNNDNSPMARVASGITGATPIFHNIMSGLLAGKPSLAWEVPENVERVAICAITGTLPCNGCPTNSEWFVEGTAPALRCSAETIARLQEERKEREREGQITPEAASTAN